MNFEGEVKIKILPVLLQGDEKDERGGVKKLPSTHKH